MSYIIDFDRVNQLTSHENDNPNSTGIIQPGSFCYSISRKYLKELVDVFLAKGSKYRYSDSSIDETYDFVVKTLRYNKILITEADIRDGKIEKIIDY